VHLVQPPWVGLEAVHRNRLLPALAFGSTAVGGVAVIVGLRCRDRSPPPKRRRRTCSSRILTLSLRQQSIGFARRLREPGNISFCVVPINAHDWMIAVLHEARVTKRLTFHIVRLAMGDDPARFATLCPLAFTKASYSLRVTENRPTAND
jgi:hypothetical protein